MKQKFLLPFLFFISTHIWAQEKIELSLENAIETALTNNFGQQILEVSKLSVSEDLSQSKRDLAPDFSASLSHAISNQNNNGSYGINGSVVLWNGGQMMNTIKKAHISLNQSDSKITQAQNTLIINIIQTFLNYLMNHELYLYQSKVAQISQQQMQQGEIKFTSGRILENDYLLLKSQYASDNYAMTNSKINRDNSMVELKNLLSIDPLTEVSLITPSTLSLETLGIPTLQELITETLAWFPDIQIASQNLELAKMDTKLAKGGLYPTISLGGSIGTNYNSTYAGNWGNQFVNNYNAQIGLTVTIPIWDKGKTLSTIKQNKFRIQQAELEAKQTELDIKSNLEKEYQNVVSFKEKYVAAEISSNAYEETFKVFSIKFEEGSVTTTELLQQQNNFLSALNNYIQSKYNYLLNRKVLDVYMGNKIQI